MRIARNEKCHDTGLECVEQCGEEEGEVNISKDYLLCYVETLVILV